MSLPDNRSAHREIVRALTEALEQALAAHPARAAISAARDAAQLLSLAGLDSVLRVLHAHADRPWPNEFLPVIERLRRLATECAGREDLTPLRSADRELGALAAQLEGLEWIESGEPMEGGRVAIPTLSLADVLEDLPAAKLVSPALQQGVRLRAPVAAALRAALDWLTNERVAPGAMRLTAQDSVLEIGCEHIDYSGLRAADQVLSAVGANLGPVAGAGAPALPGGSWMLRVPTVSLRPSYLMLIQGHLKLALPWHSVIRLCIVPAAEIETNLRGLEIPVLDPLAPLKRTSVEYPVAMVAHGLKRAYVVADRLVWRLSATPFELDRMPPHPGLSRPVRTEEGEVYWIADPASLLATIDAPRIPEPGPIEISEEDLLPTLGPEDVEPLPMPGPSAPEESGVVVLSPDDAGASEAAAALAVPEAVGAEAGAATAAAEEETMVGWPQAIAEPPPRPPGSESQTPAPDGDPLPEAHPEAEPGPGARLAPQLEPAPPALGTTEPEPEVRLAPPVEPAPPMPGAAESATSVPAPARPPTAMSVPVRSGPSTAKPDPDQRTSPKSPSRRLRRKAAAPGIAPEQPGRARPEPSASAADPKPERRALVVEDSITARIFLTRMLEQRGFGVRAVSSAAEMLAAMKGDAWLLICVDIELPDRRGKDLLDVVLEHQAEHCPRAAVVVLVRDSADLAIAAAAGTSRTLRKPFDKEELERLLTRLGLDGGKNR